MRLIAETLGAVVAAVLLARCAFPSAGPRRYVFACPIVAATVGAPPVQAGAATASGPTATASA